MTHGLSVDSDLGNSHGRSASSHPTHILFLTHGFNTFGQWDALLRAAFDVNYEVLAVPPHEWTGDLQRRLSLRGRFHPNTQIIAAGSNRLLIKSLPYDYLDLICFLIPVGTRGYVHRSIHRELDATLAAHPGIPYSIIAHSFGTFAFWQILTQFSRITPDYLILVGSIVRQARSSRMRAQWRTVASRVKKAIVNEVGLRDCWPLLAPMASCGFGNSGRFGSDASQDNPNVFDRYHPNGTHSNWYTTDQGSTMRDWWRPFFDAQITDFGEQIAAKLSDFDKANPVVAKRLEINPLMGLVYRTLSVLKPGLWLLLLLAWTFFYVAMTTAQILPALVFGDTRFKADSSSSDLASLAPGQSSSDEVEFAEWSNRLWQTYLASGMSALSGSLSQTDSTIRGSATAHSETERNSADTPAPQVVEFPPLRIARARLHGRLSSTVPLAPGARIDGCAFRVRRTTTEELLRAINFVNGNECFAPSVEAGDAFRFYVIATANADGQVFETVRSEALDNWFFTLEVEPWTMRDVGKVFTHWFFWPLSFARWSRK
jgi:hypothetical protein